MKGKITHNKTTQPAYCVSCANCEADYFWSPDYKGIFIEHMKKEGWRLHAGLWHCGGCLPADYLRVLED